MSKKVEAPRTLLAAVRFFADPENCRAFMVAMRWPDGVTCPRCGSKEVAYLENARVWKCRGKHAAQKFSAKVGTIMEDSPIGLDKWLPAIWLITNCKNGVSSYEVHRALGITQKSAWFMLHRIRLAMQESGGKLGGKGGTVQVDETYIGGRARWMNAKRRKVAMRGRGSAYATPRAIVMGMLEKGGKVVLHHIKDAKRRTLLGLVSKHVERGSQVHTDELVAYAGLVEPHYAHNVVNHTDELARV